MAKKLPKWKIDLQKVVDMAMKQVLDETTANDIPIREWIDKIASGEYQPVKHGHWELIHDPYNFSKRKCSECGYEQIVVDDMAYNFCPNCGSKNRMDGDSE